MPGTESREDLEAATTVSEALSNLSVERQERILRWVAEGLGVVSPARLRLAERQTVPQSDSEKVFYQEEDGRLVFIIPKGSGPKEVAFGREISEIETTAWNELEGGSDRYYAVTGFLAQAVVFGLLAVPPQHEDARKLLEEARKKCVYYRNLPVRNRLLYIFGAAIAAVALVALSLVRSDPPYAVPLSRQVLVSACLMAGLGSIASILSRLGQISELRQDYSWRQVMLSGGTRPAVAAIFATIVTVALNGHLLVLQVSDRNTAEGSLYLVVSFLCGFSERFPGEVLAQLTSVPETTKGSRPTSEV